jgi:uncharacterized SAM-binding protein YcdF (DUF218 family)
MPVTTPPRRATRWPLLALFVVLSAGAALLLVLAVRIGVNPSSDRPFDDGPVVVLGGGGGERLETGLRLRGDTVRPLVLSADAVDRYTAQGGTCELTDVVCLDPDPESTFGEAQAVAMLSERHGWTQVTVVTSDFHTYRTRLLFDRCLSVPVAVLGAPTDPSVGERLYRVVREVTATVVAITRRCG